MPRTDRLRHILAACVAVPGIATGEDAKPKPIEFRGERVRVDM